MKVKAILGNLDEPDPFYNIVRTTKNGESRIAHCMKYDLGDGWRLVTCQYVKTCGFLFMGKHEDAEHWLETNGGRLFGVENMRAKLVPRIGAPLSSPKHFAQTIMTNCLLNAFTRTSPTSYCRGFPEVSPAALKHSTASLVPRNLIASSKI